MPALTNQRWERYAQALVSGKSTEEAYRIAGYAPNRGNATRLKANEAIKKRVAELQGKAEDRAVVDRAWVLERLMRNVRIAMGEETVRLTILPKTGKAEDKLRKPVEIEVTDRDGTVANNALKLLGQELGMFVEQSESRNVNWTISDSPSEADWADAFVTQH